MKTTGLIVSLSLLLGACATAGVPANAKSAAHAIEHAEAAKMKAAKVGYEWRDTGSIIANAKKAAEASEFDRASELAALAERQSLAALKQYKSQRNASALD